MSRGRFENKLKRRKAQKKPRQKFIIFCEGKNTEPLYFEGIQRENRNSLIEIETIPAAGVPLTMAKAAIERAKSEGLLPKNRKKINSFETMDQVWVVFDRDEHPNFNEAISLCNSNEIKVSRSNPCFEIWILLHYENYDKACDRHDPQKRLSEICDTYSSSKGKRIEFKELFNGVNTAIERASSQLKRREEEGSPFGVPSTTAFQLVQEILGNSPKDA
ncbi:hypothetical protein MAUB1S_05817 [Mycolicibacterium aubagnense]